MLIDPSADRCVADGEAQQEHGDRGVRRREAGPVALDEGQRRRADERRERDWRPRRRGRRPTRCSGGAPPSGRPHRTACTAGARHAPSLPHRDLTTAGQRSASSGRSVPVGSPVPPVILIPRSGRAATCPDLPGQGRRHRTNRPGREFRAGGRRASGRAARGTSPASSRPAPSGTTPASVTGDGGQVLEVGPVHQLRLGRPGTDDDAGRRACAARAPPASAPCG